MTASLAQLHMRTPPQRNASHPLNMAFVLIGLLPAIPASSMLASRRWNTSSFSRPPAVGAAPCLRDPFAVVALLPARPLRCCGAFVDEADDAPDFDERRDREERVDMVNGVPCFGVESR